MEMSQIHIGSLVTLRWPHGNSQPDPGWDRQVGRVVRFPARRHGDVEVELLGPRPDEHDDSPFLWDRRYLESYDMPDLRQPEEVSAWLGR